MSETLVAILLVTSSAKGSSLVYRWPPAPQSSPRLARPRPTHDMISFQADNPWRASNASDARPSESPVYQDARTRGEDDGYLWKRPNTLRNRSLSTSHSRSRPASRRQSPSKDTGDAYSLDRAEDASPDDEYDSVLGYSAEFLATLLCPQSAMCHQKFELMVDDLAFIGHPVCAEPSGEWRFKQEKAKLAPRGRVSKKGDSPLITDKSLTPEKTSAAKHLPESSWLQTFHFVLVLDRPDPASSASGDKWKYFDTIYEQIAFTVTAVLYQEQVLHNFVEAECETLGTLKDDYVSRGQPFACYMMEALKVSSFAPAMKAIYEAIKEGSIARVTIHNLPVELQLPPHLDALLHIDDDCDGDIMDREDEYGMPNAWGLDMSFARRLPTLTPWKSLLRMDDEHGYDLELRLRSPQLTAEDRELAEQLLRFLELASITLSLADMASLLDWDLESQVYPTVRWLVHHRRAKLVDIVHPGLKTIFAVPQKLSAPLSALTAEFAHAFANSPVPPLPKLLSLISMATHQLGAHHFYATVVPGKEQLPLYHDVVLWLLRRDLLLTVHLRIRIVATEELKERVRREWEAAQAHRARAQGRARGEPRSVGGEMASGSSPAANWFSMSPKSARRHTRELSAARRAGAGTPPNLAERVREEDEEDWGSEDTEDVRWEDWYHGEEANLYASMISDPARATPLERRWLAAMSEGKDASIARRFEQINQYFDGKCTDDEILFRAEISRKQLREVLHHYEEFLETFLHP
ncbi:nitrogen permease regulator of amino acid transport activity 3-domain-containing protein [Amylocystis lapponica]|nr:nitrogen permease regulator of amino acid transport activity 3-domain-containing protein [Amylocystis lapponica]